MRLIISFLLAALMVSCATPPARSQSNFLVVSVCGTLPLAYSPGAVRPGTIDVNGKLCDTGSAATSDATAANQALQITQETAINTLLGLQADSACATDNGVCTLAALTKRNNQRLTTLNTTLGTPMQATGGTVGLVPATSGGLSVYFVQPAASDNHVVIKAGAGQVYKVSVTNNSATVNYLRLYNATTGFNGCGSATNLQYQIAIPASTSVGGISDSWELGMPFATGISICITSGYATTDTTNATASAMSVNIGYK